MYSFLLETRLEKYKSPHEPKYGNFVASSSKVEDKKIEGFILPPKNVGKTPCQYFMNYCDNIV